MPISMQRVGWEDLPSEVTPIDAGNLKAMENNAENAINELEARVAKLEDGEWINATLTGNFVNYQNNSSYAPKFRKIGKVVELGGQISPAQTIEGSATNYTIFTLPEGYRPALPVFIICEGTGINRWLLSITTDGEVRFSRYGTNDYNNAGTSSWLPFYAIFMVADENDISVVTENEI